MEFSEEFFQFAVELLKAATKDLQDMRSAGHQNQPLPIAQVPERENLDQQH
jgi:hypothetical protein